jgi:type IV secretory pathway VirB10-like protein
MIALHDPQSISGLDGANPKPRPVSRMTFDRTRPTAAALVAGAVFFAVAVFAAAERTRADEQPQAEYVERTLETTTVEAAPSDEEPLPEDIDFNALAVPLDRPYTPPPKLKSATRPGIGNAAPVWSRNDRPDGTAAVSVTRPVSPLWDMKAGIDMDVATPSSPLRTPQTLPDKLASDARVETSQASAWLSARAPGVPYLADHVALEARMNPSHDARFGTAFSKSLPLFGDQFAVTLKHGYYVVQHDALPGLAAAGGHGRDFEMDRSAQFSITETGTSFLAGQSRAATGERWLNSIGAQQKLFGGLSLTGSVSETPEGFSNKSLSAGFKKSW